MTVQMWSVGDYASFLTKRCCYPASLSPGSRERTGEEASLSWKCLPSLPVSMILYLTEIYGPDHDSDTSLALLCCVLINTWCSLRCWGSRWISNSALFSQFLLGSRIFSLLFESLMFYVRREIEGNRGFRCCNYLTDEEQVSAQRNRWKSEEAVRSHLLHPQASAASHTGVTGRVLVSPHGGLMTDSAGLKAIYCCRIGKL